METRLLKNKKEVILSRLHIGCTRITHSYLLEAKQQPMCHACQTKYTVKYILIEYTDLAHIRGNFYSANEMKQLFHNIEIKNVMSFLKAINIYMEKSKKISTRPNFFYKLSLYKKYFNKI